MLERHVLHQHDKGAGGSLAPCSGDHLFSLFRDKKGTTMGAKLAESKPSNALQPTDDRAKDVTHNISRSGRLLQREAINLPML